MGGYDFWIVKTDSLGNKIWDKDFGGTNSEDEFGNITQTSDDGYLISGTSYSTISGDKTENNLGQEQSWILKTDSLGNKQWDKTIFTTGHVENGFALQTKEGCYVIANYTTAGVGGYKTQSSQGGNDCWIIKFCDTTQSALPHPNFVSSDTVFCDEGGKCIGFIDQSINNPTAWQWYFPSAVPDTSTQQNPTNICYSTPGTYSVTLIVSNSNGSDSLTVSPMITFAASSAPPVLTFSGDTIYCSDAAAYQWYFDGSPITNATDSFYVITGDGVYAVNITDDNGCTRLSDGFPVSVYPTPTLPKGEKVRVYPNPAGNQLMIYDSRFVIGKNELIEIYDVIGENVLQYEIKNPKSEIDISSLRKGIYFIRINGSAGAIRLVKID